VIGLLEELDAERQQGERQAEENRREISSAKRTTLSR
jgi:hypothetical protein